MVDAAVLFGHTVRGSSAAFDADWIPRTGTREMSPSMMADMRAMPNRASSIASALRSGVHCGELSDPKDALGQFVEHTVAVRTATSAAVAFFAVRAASKVTQSLTSDVDVDLENGRANMKVVRRKNDQVRAGQLAGLVAITAWGDAHRLRIFAESTLFRSGPRGNGDGDGRMAKRGR